MDIVPNSNIVILRNVPLDTSYEHTLYFDSAQAQYEYFYSKRKHVFTNSSYQRVNKGWLKIGRVADDLYDCNYMMFKNVGTVGGDDYFVNKWFYAYIKQVEYINNVTCRIEYEIDSMQTWAFNYTVEESFIEREHSLTDEIGENLVPENLETGEYMFGEPIELIQNESGNTWDIVIAATWEYDGIQDEFVDYYGGNFGGVFSGLCLNWCQSAAIASEIIDKAAAAQKSAGIVGVYMCPRWMRNKFGALNWYTVQVPKAVNYNSMWGFTPKNNKLKTSPYVSMIVTNNNGEVGEYPYEYFDNAATQENPNAYPEFKIYGTYTPDAMLKCVPLNYKDVSENYIESLTISALPQCSYDVDTYKAWWAQNGLKAFVEGAGATVQLGAGIITGNVGLAVKGVATVTDIMTENYVKRRQPNTYKGNNTNTLLCLMGKMNFTAYAQFIRPEFAHIIDEYFNVYGYATHRVKRPNIGTRPHWNYVKTLRANITGSVPCDELRKIASIFDNGVTFWKVIAGGVQVGNYSQNNAPVSP